VAGQVGVSITRLIFAARARGVVFFNCSPFQVGDPLMNLHTLAIALIAVAATLPPSAAIAQTPPPGAAADTEAAVPPEAPKQPLTRKEARALQEKADARRCLEFPTPLMIIKCADKYRLNKREV